MQRDLFTPQQFPPLYCFKGSAMSPGEEGLSPGCAGEESTRDFVTWQMRHVGAALCSFGCKKWISEFAIAAPSWALTLYYWLLAALKFFYYLAAAT